MHAHGCEYFVRESFYNLFMRILVYHEYALLYNIPLQMTTGLAQISPDVNIHVYTLPKSVFMQFIAACVYVLPPPPPPPPPPPGQSQFPTEECLDSATCPGWRP